MKNIKIEKLCLEYNLHTDDAREIERIFEVLSDRRKIYVIDHFESFANRINAHREEIEKEKEILFLKAVKDLDRKLSLYSKKTT